jgi:hypothetical protein
MCDNDLNIIMGEQENGKTKAGAGGALEDKWVLREMLISFEEACHVLWVNCVMLGMQWVPCMMSNPCPTNLG